MEANNNPSRRIHPLIAVAAGSVTLVSLIGVAAITGILPSSHSTNTPPADTAVVASAPDSTAQAAASTDAKNPFVAGTASATDTAREVPAEAPVVTHHTHSAPVAKAHYPHHSPAVIAANTAPAESSYPNQPPAVAQAPAICDTCGTVESVEAVQQAAKPSGVGAVAGALIGGALANQVGHGNGKALATLAGTIGGGFAGNAIEKRTHTATTYRVVVHMEDGSTRTFQFANAPAWHNGDRVRVVNDTLTARG